MKYLTRSHSKEACICSCLSEMGSLIPQIGIKWFRLPFMNRKFRKIQILKPSKLCNCTAHLHSGSFKPSALQHACFPALQNTVKNCNITKDFEHIMKYFFYLATDLCTGIFYFSDWYILLNLVYSGLLNTLWKLPVSYPTDLVEGTWGEINTDIRTNIWNLNSIIVSFCLLFTVLQKPRRFVPGERKYLPF